MVPEESASKIAVERVLRAEQKVVPADQWHRQSQGLEAPESTQLLIHEDWKVDSLGVGSRQQVVGATKVDWVCLTEPLAW